MINFEEEKTIKAYDDLPLWSAKSGLLLLDNLKLEKNSKVLDIGCGTGFPILEIAQRVGNSTTVYGLDIWKKGLERAEEKAKSKEISNVIFTRGVSQKIPFESNFFNKIISNNGFNGCNGSIEVFRECHRVLKENSEICFTAILPDTLKNFYKILIKVMKSKNINKAEIIVNNHISQKRLNLEEYRSNLEFVNFEINTIKKTNYDINFIDEDAFFHYYFFKLNFIENWLSIIPKELQDCIIKDLKKNINNEIISKGAFTVKICSVYIEAIKNRGK